MVYHSQQYLENDLVLLVERIGRHRGAVSACGNEHQNPQVNRAAQELNRRISQPTVRSTGMERVDLALIGAIDAAFVGAVGSSGRRNVRKLRWSCSRVEPRTIHRDVVALMSPRTIHVSPGATGILLDPIVAAPPCRPSGRFGNRERIAQPIGDRSQLGELVGSHPPTASKGTRIRRIVLGENVPNRSTAIPIATVDGHVVGHRRPPISRRASKTSAISTA